MRARLVQRVLVPAIAMVGVSGCVGMAIGAATDAAIEVGKVPFKVGGAVVDVVRDDEKDDDDNKKDDK